MRVLLIGNGAREHVVAETLKKSYTNEVSGKPENQRFSSNKKIEHTTVSPKKGSVKPELMTAK